MAENDWKSILSALRGDAPEPEDEPLSFDSQRLIVTIDRRHRGGKQVTIVSGFSDNFQGIDQLGKTLKEKCGCGGSVKEGVIIIQGDNRDKLVSFLNDMGHKAKRGN